jgi:hypothetical protein
LSIRTVALCFAATASVATVGAAFAQALPKGVEAIPHYNAPHFGPKYFRQLKRLPDINGQWMPTAGGKPRPSEMMFDPEHFYFPPDPAQGDLAGAGLVAPLPGSRDTDIPYNAEYQAKYEANVKSTINGQSVDEVAACRPYGFPRVMGGNPSGPEITVTPEVVIMTFDQGSAIRHIYTDGRGHPKGEGYKRDVEFRWNGHSIGHWEGDTLVVDTVGMYPAYFDQTDPPFSDALHVVERIRLISHDWLEDQMTLTDPKAFTRPWVVTRYYVRGNPKYRNYGDFFCAPNGEVDTSKGYQDVVLPQEREQDTGGGK